MAYQYKREPLTLEELDRLDKACQSPFERLVVWTLADTGLRVGELAGLTRQSLDFQSDRLTVYGKGGPYGKKSKRRVIPLTARTIQNLVRRRAVRAGIARKVSPHVLRHTFSVKCIRKNIPLPVLQRLLGHDHLSTTEIYLNLSPEDVIREFRERW